MATQTNDTDLHQWTRKRFIEKQAALLLRKSRTMGGGLVEATREENTDLMIEVMQDPELHKQASKGYKYTGTTVALDGSEDWRICREAGEFRQELQMRPKVNAAVAEVKAACERG